MALNVPTELERHIDEIITHYPPQHKRAAVLWLLHLLQEQFGHLGKEQVEWTATKLGLQPTVQAKRARLSHGLYSVTALFF